MLKPTVWYQHITQVPAAFFKERGLRLAVLDVDNTLTTHDNPVPAEGVTDWLAAMEGEGIIFLILSNNSPERVAPFAELLGLSFAANAAKPLPFGLNKAMKAAGVGRKETAIIGDQLFTDMLCGNLRGITTVLVEPWQPEDHGFLKTKRSWEKPFLARYGSVKQY